MSRYAVIGGSIWGNRGAEAMAVTTIARVREKDPEAEFLLFTYFPERDRELVDDPRIEIHGAKPVQTIVQVIFSFVCWLFGLMRIRIPNLLLPASVRRLRKCRALFDISGVSFHDGRLAVVAYNVTSVLPALLLGVPVVRLSQAMGPFENVLNRWPARLVTKASFQSFARGRISANFVENLGVPPTSWSVAADIAFSYSPGDSLTEENTSKVADVVARLDSVRNSGTKVVALVPSSLVLGKLADDDRDYVGMLIRLAQTLQAKGLHVVVLPNATRAGESATRNNDLVVVEKMKGRSSEMNGSATTFVDFDVNTAGIREVIQRSSVLITSRFHAMVAGLALEVPTLVLGWSHKYEEVLETFGCADHAIDFSSSFEELESKALSLLAEEDQIRERISKSLSAVTESSSSQFAVVGTLPGG